MMCKAQLQPTVVVSNPKTSPPLVPPSCWHSRRCRQTYWWQAVVTMHPVLVTSPKQISISLIPLLIQVFPFGGLLLRGSLVASAFGVLINIGSVALASHGRLLATAKPE